jgi:HTH-type transcriptional regulator, competence development regulator
MDTLGVIIRQQRENRRIPLRIIASFLNIDLAILSKIERGQRKATRDQVLKLSKYFGIEEEKLIVAWLSDKILYELKGEAHAKKALKIAENKIEYLKHK